MTVENDDIANMIQEELDKLNAADEKLEPALKGEVYKNSVWHMEKQQSKSLKLKRGQHDYLFRRGSEFLRNGGELSELRAVLSGFNQRNCDPQLTVFELDRIADSITFELQTRNADFRTNVVIVACVCVAFIIGLAVIQVFG